MSTITNWFKTQLNNPQVVFLTLFLLAFFAVLVFMGQMLAPLLAAIVIAYLLEGLVKLIQRLGISRLLGGGRCLFGIFAVCDFDRVQG